MNKINSKPLKVYVMYCSNSLDVNQLDDALPENSGDEFKMISLPCTGKVNVLYLVKAFETGADGIVLITCGPGECRHLEGNLRAPKRAEKVNSLMSEIGMGGERIVIMSGGDMGIDGIVSGISEFCEQIRNLAVVPAARVS